MQSSATKQRPSFLKRTFKSHRFLLFLFLFAALAIFSVLNPYIESRISTLHNFEEDFIKSEFFSSRKKRFRHLNRCSKKKKSEPVPFVRSNWTAFQEITGRRLLNVSRWDATESKQTILLHILVHADCDLKSLQKTLNSISNAKFQNEIVHLSVVSNCPDALDQLEGFQWKQGSFRLIQSQSTSSIDSLEYVYPDKPNEFFFLLSSSSVVSPDFYSTFKIMLSEFFENVDWMGSSSGGEKDKNVKNVNDEETISSSFSSETTEMILNTQKQGSSSENNFFGISLDASFSLRHSEILNAELSERNQKDEEMDETRTPAFLSQSLTDTCQILLPRAWDMFWKWHVLHQFDVNKKKVHFEPNAMDFSLPCRSDWKRSFYTFVSEKKYFNLHPNYSPPNNRMICSGPSTPSPKPQNVPKSISFQNHTRNWIRNVMRSVSELPHLDLCGQILNKGYLAKNIDQLKVLLRKIHSKNSVIGVMISPSFKEMMLNWICYVKELGVTNFFFITQSDDQAQELVDKGMDVFIPQMNTVNQTDDKNSTDSKLEDKTEDDESNSGDPLNYGSVSYKQFISTRTHFIGQILHLGYKVLLADVDSVWLSDPFPHMQEKGFDIFAQLEYSGNPCGGFLYLLPTSNVTQLWDHIDMKFEQHISWLRTHPSRSNITKFNSFIKSQQHNHEQTFLREVLKRNQFGVKMKGLDPLLFINGRDFFTRKKSIKANITPVMIHNNYIIGKANKIRRFMHNGMWRLDYSGSCKCLDTKCGSSSRNNKRIQNPVQT